MRRARETAGDWLVAVVPLGGALLALAGYLAWQWFTRPRFVGYSIF